MKANFSSKLCALPAAFLLFYSNVSVSQISGVLDTNNIKAYVAPGIFFSRPAQGLPGYEAPINSGTNAIFSMGFWFSATDTNDIMYLSAQKYNLFEDLFSGPLSTDGTATPPSPTAWTQDLFPISQSQIDYHLANYTNAGYVAPAEIANWPAHGDVTQGFDYYLAPFVDADNDGNYNPLNGDYPCIKGDKAFYIIMNDKGGAHATLGTPMGIEVHFMVYQYASSDARNNATFLSARVINRSTNTFNDFRIGNFIDTDLGNPLDDYMGSDSSRHLIYTYNGDNMDESAGGFSGYGSAPPAIGLMALNTPLDHAISLGDQSSPLLALSSPFMYYRRMRGLDNQGYPLIQPGYGTNSNYFYSGNPYTVVGESEIEVGTLSGDRQLLSVIASNDFAPGEVKVYDYAMIYYRGQSNVESVNGLLSVADSVQNFYDADPSNCIYLIANVDEIQPSEMMIYPNPSDGQFTLKFDHTISDGSIMLSDLSGRTVYKTKVNTDQLQISINEPAGVYLLSFEENGRISYQKVVIE